MAKVRNQRIWSSDRDLLQRIADEQENYIGRQYKLDLAQGLLIIYALPQAKPKKKIEREHAPRNKKAESAARRN